MKNVGSIVNVSSIDAIETTPLVSACAAFKAALVSLTHSATTNHEPPTSRGEAMRVHGGRLSRL